MVLTNQLKKYIKSLHKVKYRQKYNKFIAEGPKICKEFLISKKFDIDFIICSQEGLDEFDSYLSKNTEKTIVCSNKDLKTISTLTTPNKILIVLSSNLSDINTFDPKISWAYYLDHVQDPGNMGAILRIADWYNINKVISSPDSVDVFSPKVIQSAMGAHNRVNMVTISPENLIESYSNHLISMSLDGKSIDGFKELSSGIIVIGNEGKGISQKIQDNSPYKIMIPRRGGAESLNASVACGIATHVLLNNET